MLKGANMIKCPRCKGEMRIKDPQRDGVNSGIKMPCPDCEGEGTINLEVDQ